MGSSFSGQILQSQRVRTINHPKMKNVKFLNNNEIMRCIINIDNESEFLKWEQQLLKLNNYDEYYLLLPKAYSFEKKSICGSSGILKIDFDNYPFVLNDEIRNRMVTTNYFSQIELWYLLYGLVSATKTFSKIDSKVGDIEPKNIFINQEGQIKISNVCSWPGEQTNYEKLVFQHIPTYVAPEQLQWVKDGRINIYNKNIWKCDKYVCESFSIGLTMLQCLMLTPSIKLYSCQGSVIDKEELDKRLTKMLQGFGKNKYSTELKIAILSLCQVEPENRLTAAQLYEILKQHDSELTNLKPCAIHMPVQQSKNKYNDILNENKKKLKDANTTTNHQSVTSGTNNTAFNINNSKNNNLILHPQVYNTHNYIRYGSKGVNENKNDSNNVNNYLSANQYGVKNNLTNTVFEPANYNHSHSGSNGITYNSHLTNINSKPQQTHYSSDVNCQSSQPSKLTSNIINPAFASSGSASYLTLGNKLPYSYSFNMSSNTNSNKSYGYMKSSNSAINNTPLNKTAGNYKLIKIGNNSKVAKQNNVNNGIVSSVKQNPTAQMHSINDNSMNVCDLSSITKQNNFTFNSQLKAVDNINAFTPTQTYNRHYITTENKSYDSGFDLLNKINEEIQKSKTIAWQ